jgi:hypothetical protein
MNRISNRAWNQALHGGVANGEDASVPGASLTYGASAQGAIVIASGIRLPEGI